jgi:hypothetical protein
MPDSFASFVNNPSAPSVRFVPVVKAEVDLPGGTCKALLARVAGTANLVDAEGACGPACRCSRGILRCAACAWRRAGRRPISGRCTDVRFRAGLGDVALAWRRLRHGAGAASRHAAAVRDGAGVEPVGR